jgi:RNA polymerase sigma-54 factor
MMLDLSLENKISQKATPLQIKLGKILELNSNELLNFCEKESEENDLIEIDKEKIDNFYSSNFNEFQKDYSKQNIYDDFINKNSEKYQIREVLLDQISLMNLNERERKITQMVIDNLDQNGYLHFSADILANLFFINESVEIKEEEILNSIKIIQSLDPAGVGASSMIESLILQIKRKNFDKNIEDLIIKILENSLSKKNFDKKKYKNFKEDDIEKALLEIKKLSVKPFVYENFFEKNICIDFYLEEDDFEPRAKLENPFSNFLKINKKYFEKIESIKGGKKENMNFLKKKLTNAEKFLFLIQERDRNFQKIIDKIVEIQKEFFVKKNKFFLKPMSLKDIASTTNLDISTISRICNNKFIRTSFGVFPLKYFFSYSISKFDGHKVGNSQIKFLIKDIISNEDKKNPYRDLDISEILKKKGYKIARRTITKYRESLNIENCKKRKIN